MTEFVEKKCPTCGVHYCLDRDYDQHRQNGVKKDDGSLLDWYCPNGHNLVYRENEATRMRRERDRWAATWRRNGSSEEL
jgi:hypothetical protein